MNIKSNPSWLDQYRLPYNTYEEIPSDIFESINKRLDKIQSDEPDISVIIPAWNEEMNILRCIASLSNIKTNYSLEIIVVNNNSHDRTQDTIDRLHVKSLFQKVQGCGPARQLGQENARGKYILLADADCLYPESWVDEMMKELKTPNVVCVYGRYSFISEAGYPRWQLFLLEKMKDVIAEVRHYKRPYLNAYGMSMGYLKEPGLQVGFVMRHIRGEDGRLCFDLMRFGKIKQVKSAAAKVWTPPRTLQLDGSLRIALQKRVLKEVKRFSSMFSLHPPHDTKISANE